MSSAAPAQALPWPFPPEEELSAFAVVAIRPTVGFLTSTSFVLLLPTTWPTSLLVTDLFLKMSDIIPWSSASKDKGEGLKIAPKPRLSKPSKVLPSDTVFGNVEVRETSSQS